MKKSDAEKILLGLDNLARVVKSLIVGDETKANGLTAPGRVTPLPSNIVIDPKDGVPVPGRNDAGEVDRLFRLFKARLIDELKVDPVFVQLLSVQSEIVVEISPRIVTLDGGTLKGRVARLVAAGFFDTARATGAARKELARTGPDPGGGGALSDTLGAFVRDGLLVREGSDYARAPGLKVTEKVIEAR